MKKIRRFLLLLLCLALPLQGMAAARMMAGNGCHDPLAGVSSSTGTADTGYAAAPCAQHADDGSPANSPCQDGKHCQLCSHYTAAITESLPTVTTAAPLSLFIESIVPPSRVSGVWRPPQTP